MSDLLLKNNHYYKWTGYRCGILCLLDFRHCGADGSVGSGGEDSNLK